MNLVLASASPRRSELLRQMALPFSVVIADIDESRLPGEVPAAYVERLAQEKSQAGYRLAAEQASASVNAGQNAGEARNIVLGADTIVVLDDEILGKPRGLTESTAMVTRLSGRTHQVFTGVAAFDGQRLESQVVVSEVTFQRMSEADIQAYVASGEGMDKAGSYGIQGIGGIFVERIEGSFSAVMGLPVAETEALLTSLNMDTWSMRNQWLKNSL